MAAKEPAKRDSNAYRWFYAQYQKKRKKKREEAEE